MITFQNFALKIEISRAKSVVQTILEIRNIKLLDKKLKYNVKKTNCNCTKFTIKELRQDR